MRPLGKLQADMLFGMACGRFLISPDKICKSLVARGLMKCHGHKTDSFAHITPAGLRCLADEIESGRLVIDVELIKPAALRSTNEGEEK